jgi:hypothetical protein
VLNEKGKNTSIGFPPLFSENLLTLSPLSSRCLKILARPISTDFDRFQTKYLNIRMGFPLAHLKTTKTSS